MRLEAPSALGSPFLTSRIVDMMARGTIGFLLSLNSEEKLLKPFGKQIVSVWIGLNFMSSRVNHSDNLNQTSILCR